MTHLSLPRPVGRARQHRATITAHSRHAGQQGEGGPVPQEDMPRSGAGGSQAAQTRRGCGTKPSHRVWLNLDPCGLACVAMTWAIVIYANWAVTVRWLSRACSRGSASCKGWLAPGLQVVCEQQLFRKALANAEKISHGPGSCQTVAPLRTVQSSLALCALAAFCCASVVGRLVSGHLCHSRYFPPHLLPRAVFPLEG